VEFREAMGNRIYGCDDCLAVCPWNKFASKARNEWLQARETLNRPDLAELARLDDAAFRALFSGSPVKRMGRDRFVRNVLIAIGNSGADRLVPVARERLDDEAAVVRAMSVWALGRLAPAELARWKDLRHSEGDAEVRREWARSLPTGTDTR
jgi:epoxyqueuosine reductase